MVGTPLNDGDGCGVVTAIARSLPLSTKVRNRRGGAEDHVDLAAEQVGDGRSRAAIGHVRHLDLGEVGEHLAGQMRRRAVAL